jgi:very-short-patch-repair endonuclease
MDVVTVIEQMGGLGTRASLIAATSRDSVDRALGDGEVVRVGQGRYTLPGIEAAPATAHAMNGHLSLSSAALHHGWEVKALPERPHVVVPRKRNVPHRFRDAVVLHRRDLLRDEVDGPATSKVVTLAQCLRLLPYDEALVIADSALRHGERESLRRAAALVRGRGQSQAGAVAGAASAKAANPFESVTRAICHSVTGLRVEPQVVISTPHCWARPDLVDVDLRIVVECESFEWHGNRAGFWKDVRRYTLLAAEGWTVLRFTWEDVMFRPDWVRAVLVRTARGDARTLVRREARVAA